MSKKKDKPVVAVGQVWESCDPSQNGRRIQVMKIDENGHRASCINMATGHGCMVKVRDLHPSARGYKLIREAQAKIA